jgi:hypothetical protein
MAIDFIYIIRVFASNSNFLDFNQSTFLIYQERRVKCGHTSSNNDQKLRFDIHFKISNRVRV